MNKKNGFTLIELMIVVAIIGLLAMIAYPSYQDSRDAVDNGNSASDIGVLIAAIERYTVIVGQLPDSLTEIKRQGKKDPWEKRYEYLRIDGNRGARPRVDRSMRPLNTDYDLYSKGKDGEYQSIACKRG